MANKKFTELSELGEFGLIDRLTAGLEIKNNSTVKGVGDDAAVIKYENDIHTVITTDMLVEGVHFNLGYVPLKHLGYKAVVVNLSDIYAMNATPAQIVVSIAVSNRFTVEALDELFSGIRKACEVYKVDLVGGDTTSSTKGLIISITAIGQAEKQDIVYRSGANVSDLICVSGDLGAAYAGLQLLERENAIFLANPEIQPKLDGYDYILERQLKPEARADIVRLLKEIGVKPTSMIDISDGLSSEILHICKNSDKGCEIYEERIPIAAETDKMAKELNLDSTLFALNGGEDYELLFTVKLSDYEKIKNLPQIKIIGNITEKKYGNKLIAKEGSSVELTAQGWNHNFS